MVPAAIRQASQKPDWVIDVTAACLVPGAMADKYVALSYVWPTPAPDDTLLLERANMARFRMPGFFLDDYNIARIPQVIQDAVRLTQGIGERFVWVDRLCLIQNDTETYAQVQHMHEIYWGAYLTIIAATSESLYGSEGCLTPSSLLSQQKSDFPFPLQHAGNDHSDWWAPYHLALMHEHYDRLSRSKWGTRGWTYQEKILSRRAIILLDDDMFWDCQCALWDCNGLDPFTETTTTGQGWNKPDKQEAQKNGHHHCLNMRLTPSTSADFSLYVELVCPYNARELTYAHDVVPAFTGILKTLAPAFPAGFVAGIPLSHISTMLLWQPRKGGALRREATANPSWSWTGWRCEIDPWSLRAGLATVQDRPSAMERAGSWVIRDAVECVVVSREMSWHVAGVGQARVGRVEARQDGVLWFKYTNNSDGSSTSTGEAFQFGSVPREIPLVDSVLFVQSSSAFFKVWAKETAFQEPPEADVRFRKFIAQPPKPPPPLSSSASAGLFGSSTGGGGLFGSIPKVSVYESAFGTLLGDMSIGESLILRSTCGSFAGVVRALDDRQVSDSTVELIALSLGSVRYRELDAEYAERWRQEKLQSPESPIQESKNPPYPRFCSLVSLDTLPPISGAGTIGPPQSQLLGRSQEDMNTEGNRDKQDDGVFEFYNILLIERQGDIAYRRGCGRVPKGVWEKNAVPPQRFVLG